jgi:hypothetical protein
MQRNNLALDDRIRINKANETIFKNRRALLIPYHTSDCICLGWRKKRPNLAIRSKPWLTS